MVKVYLTHDKKISAEIRESTYQQLVKVKDKFIEWLSSIDENVDVKSCEYDYTCFMAKSEFNFGMKLDNELFRDLTWSKEDKEGYVGPVLDLIGEALLQKGFITDIESAEWSLTSAIVLLSFDDAAEKVKEVESKIEMVYESFDTIGSFYFYVNDDEEYYELKDDKKPNLRKIAKLYEKVNGVIL